MPQQIASERITIWWSLAMALVVWSIAVAGLSQGFDYDRAMLVRPVWLITAVFVAAGLVYSFVLRAVLLYSTAPERDTQTAGKPILYLIIGAGLVARVILIPSQPILEDDFYRYLWDGAVTANGHNPYRRSPEYILQQGQSSPLNLLAVQSGQVLSRVGHGELTTIYPPLSQAIFAISHLIAPWSLTAWKLILLTFDLATLACLLALLKATSRSSAWVAMYWWNPVVIKEVFNSAHMDVLVCPFVTGALLLSTRRPLLATACIGVATGIKFWPVILMPLILRPIWGNWRKIANAGFVLAPFLALAIVPQVATRMDDQAGLVAYAQTWSRNSALYPTLEAVTGALLSAIGLSDWDEGLLTRGALASTICAVALLSAVRPIQSIGVAVSRAIAVIATLFMLSPAQYPWYAIWFAPLLVIQPSLGLALVAATIPLYGLSFSYAAEDRLRVFENLIVWLIWVPIWYMLVLEFKRYLKRTYLPQFTYKPTEE
jgi:alpha-1,6-mannosyltransferase